MLRLCSGASESLDDATQQELDGLSIVLPQLATIDTMIYNVHRQGRAR